MEHLKVTWESGGSPERDSVRKYTHYKKHVSSNRCSILWRGKYWTVL